MIKAILNFSVHQRLLVILGTLMLAGFGLLAVRQIPIDAFPDVTNVQVQILSTAGGMSPPEVEKLVTRPLEMSIAGLPRLTEVRSVSKIGLSAITVVFEDGVDDYFARQLVSERLQAVRESLPAGTEVGLGPITTGLGEIYQYTLISRDAKYDATELRTIQDYIVRPILRTVPGVTDVNSFGGLVKQYQVIVNPDRLTSFGITLAQVFGALEKNNANASGNFIEHKSEQYVVRGLGLVKDVRDIGNIIVTLRPCVGHPWLVGLAALLALGGSFTLVPRIGTEFLPSLDEGSIAVQTFRIPSISLPQSLALQTEAEKILKQFPEVIDVVSKTGCADIASDPMGVEISDVIVTLKPREEWGATESKEELVEKMRVALAELPGVAASFPNPLPCAWTSWSAA